MPRRKKLIHNTKQQGMTEKEYLDFCDVKITDEFQHIKNKLLWRTIGKKRNKPPHWVKLTDCDTTHLQNILINVKYTHPITKRVIISLLHDRWIEAQRQKDKKIYKDLIQIIDKWQKKGYSLETIDKIIDHAKPLNDHGSRTTIHIGTIDITDNENGVMIKRNSKNK